MEGESEGKRRNSGEGGEYQWAKPKERREMRRTKAVMG